MFSGGGFAKGSINLGGLEVRQCSSFTKVWAALEGGPENLGATFFKPSPVPAGFSVLGCYAQPNNRALFGWVLCGRDLDGGALRKPTGYSLLWTSESSKIRKHGDGYFWLPTAPEGYRAVGILVTSSPAAPSPEEIRCVRSDLTDECEKDEWVWGGQDGIQVHSLRPTVRGSGAAGVCVGTCMAAAPPLWCLKNMAPLSRFMPCASQIEALVRAYSPWIYFHPDEPYLPSSVGWFFDNGALLYKKDSPAPAAVDSAGSNLPQGGANADEYWLDLPADEAARSRLKMGDLQSSEAYVHVKPMLGGTFTDVVVWVFYPFNGPARAKVEFLNISFKRLGEHVGDWEHVTLRVSNFSGELRRVFFAEHSSGEWKEASEVEFQGGNKPVVYAALHGHAAYPHPGLVLQGGPAAGLGVGIRDDTKGGGRSLDTGGKYRLVAVDHLGSVVGPPWLNFLGEWGPKVSYDFAEEVKKAARLLPRKLRERLEKLLQSLPPGVLGEEGPTGPKEKRNWAGDEG